MAQVTCLNGYDAFCDCAACEALETSFQDKAAAEQELYYIQVERLSLHDYAGSPKWKDQSEAQSEADKADADPYYRFNRSLEETNAQRALRLKTDAELNELYGAQADAFYAALMDNESMVETAADDR